MKSAVAAAAAPMMPAGLASALPYSAQTYAKAADIARGGAYLSATFLKFRLGLDDGASNAIARRLAADGLVGDAGRNGLLYSKAFFAEHAKIAKLASKTLAPAKAARKAIDIPEALEDVLEDEIGEAETDTAKVESAPSDLIGEEETHEV